MFNKMRFFASKAKVQNSLLHMQQCREEDHVLNLESANGHLLSNMM